MKRIIIIPDGMADQPIAALGDKTPLEAAKTPNMDHLTQHGMTGLVKLIPEGMKPGSDVGNMAILGYDPKEYLTGRASLEAANLDITLADDQIAFRCNLVTINKGKMADYSAGHIRTQEASELVESLNNEIDADGAEFFSGKSYRHLLVLNVDDVNAFRHIQTTPPHDILGKHIATYLPSGKSSEELLALMDSSTKILKEHPINHVRVDLGENPANMIWLWGQGTRPRLPSFNEKYGVKGGIISAVDLISGIGKLAGLNNIDVPGITGYIDTNYKGKADYALEFLKKNDFVCIHIEAPDEASHNGDMKAKIQAIEDIDKHIVGTILKHYKDSGDIRILVLPDHPTPVALRTHTSDPVCFAMSGGGIPHNGSKTYGETSAQDEGLKFDSGVALMDYFMNTNLHVR